MLQAHLSVQCSYVLSPVNTKPENNPVEIQSLAFRINATMCGERCKQVELVQSTTKREKGDRIAPESK